MKIRFFKNIAAITIVLIGLFFIMNDGKKEVIANEHKQLDADPIKLNQAFKKVRFLPKEYTESVTDTTLANGYHITIKYKSLMDRSIVKKDLIINGGNETYYRKFTSSIKVLKDDDQLVHFELPIVKTNRSKILQYVWLDELASSEEKLVIQYAMYDPIADRYTDHQIYIDLEGKLTYIDLKNNV
ncbi:hypothetical protein [Spongiivirga citrea]|uniref:Uncharacterized protein n=1 Tax=Spongiivirga citrea TaxID=1481457 RepID=A0A6M0CYN6_9FLAO|nr:hypothetical protein [Spongiivirga citrea]NER18850.1 hypothetical protein [Spongiivirga citrea]